MGRRYRSSSRQRKIDGLQDIQKLFSACFSPIPNCNSMGSMYDDIQKSSKKDSRSQSRSKKHDAIWKVGEGIKRQISKAIASRRDDESFISRKKDATLINELEMKLANSSHTDTDSLASEVSRRDSGTFGSSSEAKMNTTDDNVVVKLKGKRKAVFPGTPINKSALSTNVSIDNTDSMSSALKHLPGAYKQSVRSKFDYYRKHQSFGEVEKPLPSNLQAFLAKELKKENISQPSPAARRNAELAKQILKRRHNYPQTPGRSREDPWNSSSLISWYSRRRFTVILFQPLLGLITKSWAFFYRKYCM